MSKIEQVVSRVEYEVTVTVLLLSVLALVVADEAKLTYGWIRYLSALDV